MCFNSFISKYGPSYGHLWIGALNKVRSSSPKKKHLFQYKLIGKIKLGPHLASKFIYPQIFEKQCLQLENREFPLSFFDLEAPGKTVGKITQENHTFEILFC